jgi:hypothetical protein
MAKPEVVGPSYTIRSTDPMALPMLDSLLHDYQSADALTPSQEAKLVRVIEDVRDGKQVAWLCIPDRITAAMLRRFSNLCAERGQGTPAYRENLWRVGTAMKTFAATGEIKRVRLVSEPEIAGECECRNGIVCAVCRVLERKRQEQAEVKAAAAKRIDESFTPPAPTEREIAKAQLRKQAAEERANVIVGRLNIPGHNLIELYESADQDVETAGAQVGQLFVLSARLRRQRETDPMFAMISNEIGTSLSRLRELNVIRDGVAPRVQGQWARDPEGEGTSFLTIGERR